MEIVRDSHSISFNYMFWEILRERNYSVNRDYVAKLGFYVNSVFKRMRF